MEYSDQLKKLIVKADRSAMAVFGKEIPFIDTPLYIRLAFRDVNSVMEYYSRRRLVGSLNKEDLERFENIKDLLNKRKEEFERDMKKFGYRL